MRAAAVAESHSSFSSASLRFLLAQMIPYYEKPATLPAVIIRTLRDLGIGLPGELSCNEQC